MVEEPRSGTHKCKPTSTCVTFECHSNEMLEAIVALSGVVPESHNPQDDTTPKSPGIPLRGGARLHSRTVEGGQRRLFSPSIVESASHSRLHGSGVGLVDEFVLRRTGRVPRDKRHVDDGLADVEDHRNVSNERK